MSDLLQARKVLVTGAGGFIGSHLVEALIYEGQMYEPLYGTTHAVMLDYFVNWIQRF